MKDYLNLIGFILLISFPVFSSENPVQDLKNEKNKFISKEIQSGQRVKKVVASQPKQSIHFLVGTGADRAQLTLTNSSKISLTGQSFQILTDYQRQILKRYLFSLGFNYDQINTSGTDSAIVSCSLKCTYQVSYMGLSLGWFYSEEWFNQVYGLIGLTGSLMYPIKKESNIVDISTVGLSGKISLDLGLNWFLNRENYIPLRVSGSYMPNAQFININQLLFKVGYGFNF